MNNSDQADELMPIYLLMDIIKKVPNEIILQHQRSFNTDTKIKRDFVEDYLWTSSFQKDPYERLVKMLQERGTLPFGYFEVLKGFIITLIAETKNLCSMNGAKNTPSVFLPSNSFYYLFYASERRLNFLGYKHNDSGFFVVPVNNDITVDLLNGTLTMPRLFQGFYGIDKRPIKLFDLRKKNGHKLLTLNGESVPNICTDKINQDNPKEHTELIKNLIACAEKLEEIERNRNNENNVLTYAERFAVVDIQLDCLTARHNISLPGYVNATNWNVAAIADFIRDPSQDLNRRAEMIQERIQQQIRQEKQSHDELIEKQEMLFRQEKQIQKDNLMRQEKHQHFQREMREEAVEKRQEIDMLKQQEIEINRIARSQHLEQEKERMAINHISHLQHQEMEREKRARLETEISFERMAMRNALNSELNF